MPTKPIISREIHGMHGTPEYRAWQHMKERCYQPKTKQFESYGGRGITVCEQWRHSFIAFFRDMGPRPSPLHTIERSDNDGPYSPNNCVWATRREQAQNRRNTVFIEFRGQRLTSSQWAEITGIPRKLIFKRIFERGWTPQRALETMIKH